MNNFKLKNKIKIIFTDLDGTLLNNQSELSDYSRKVLQEAAQKNIHIITCSGRANSDLCKRMSSICDNLIIISSNGTMVYDAKNDLIIYQSIMDKDKVKEIFKYAKDNDIGITLNTKSARYRNDKSNKTANIINSIDEINEDITQIVVETECLEKSNDIKNYINKIDNFETKETWNFIDPSINKEIYEFDAINKGENKGKAVDNTLKYFDIKKEESICFGDQMNDYEMFKSCGISVAVKNANEKLKKVANYITESNIDDGVGQFIYKNILHN